MATIESRFLTGMITDKKFPADGMAEYIRRIMNDGMTELGANLQATANGASLNVVVNYGAAFIRGYLFKMSDDGGGLKTVAIAPGDAQPRIDRIVLRLSTDPNDPCVRLIVKKGVPAASPVPPAVLTGGIRTKQLLTNSEFVDSDSGWSKGHSTNTLNSDDNLINTGSGSASNPYIVQTLAQISEHQYYLSFLCRVLDSGCLRIRARYGGSGWMQIDNPTIDTWYKSSMVKVPDSNTAYLIRDYTDSAAANGKRAEVVYVRLYDQTNIFGAGSEPAAAEMDRIIDNGIEYYEIPIASVSVAAGATSIVQGNITDERAIASGKTATALTLDTMPVGFSMPWWSDTLPSAKYLFGEGQSLTSYPDAAAAFGANLPDTRGRALVGKAASGTFGTIKATPGAETSAAILAHTHGIDHDHGAVNTGNQSADHTHGFSGNTGGRSQGHTHQAASGSYKVGSGSTSSYAYLTNGGPTGPQNTGGESVDHYHGFSGNTGGISATHTHSVDLPAFSGTSDSAGSGSSFSLVQPSIVCRWIFKVIA